MKLMCLIISQKIKQRKNINKSVEGAHIEYFTEKELIVGIYKITNIKNNQIYIGESINIKKRWNKHFYDLQNKIHHNYKIQKDFNIFGASSFRAEVLKRIVYTNYNETKLELLREEKARIEYEKLNGKELYNLENEYYSNNEINESYEISKKDINENNLQVEEKINQGDRNENIEDKIEDGKFNKAVENEYGLKEELIKLINEKWYKLESEGSEDSFYNYDLNSKMKAYISFDKFINILKQQKILI